MHDVLELQSSVSDTLAIDPLTRKLVDSKPRKNYLWFIENLEAAPRLSRLGDKACFTGA